jgi:hypothetical protein
MSEWIKFDHYNPPKGIILAYDCNSYFVPSLMFWECGHGWKCVDGQNRSNNITHYIPVPKTPYKESEE